MKKEKEKREKKKKDVLNQILSQIIKISHDTKEIVKIDLTIPIPHLLLFFPPRLPSFHNS